MLADSTLVVVMTNLISIPPFERLVSSFTALIEREQWSLKIHDSFRNSLACMVRGNPRHFILKGFTSLSIHHQSVSFFSSPTLSSPGQLQKSRLCDHVVRSLALSPLSSRGAPVCHSSPQTFHDAPTREIIPGRVLVLHPHLPYHILHTLPYHGLRGDSCPPAGSTASPLTFPSRPPKSKQDPTVPNAGKPAKLPIPTPV